MDTRTEYSVLKITYHPAATWSVCVSATQLDSGISNRIVRKVCQLGAGCNPFQKLLPRVFSFDKPSSFFAEMAVGARGRVDYNDTMNEQSLNVLVLLCLREIMDLTCLGHRCPSRSWSTKFKAR